MGDSRGEKRGEGRRERGGKGEGREREREREREKKGHTRVSDGHDTGSVILATTCSQIDIISSVVVHSTLGQHSVVLHLRLAKRRDVA